MVSIPLFSERCLAPRLPSGATPVVEYVHALAPYGCPLWRDMIRAIKYDQVSIFEEALKRLFFIYHQGFMERWLFDTGADWTLVAIPTEEAHVLERGGDHMKVWARALQYLLPRIQEGRGLLHRKKAGESHAAKLLKGSREIESKEAFLAHDVEQKSILLLDDVYTTGATAQAAASALMRAGAARVEIIVGALS